MTDTDGNGALSFQEFFAMMVLWQEVNLANVWYILKCVLTSF